MASPAPSMSRTVLSTPLLIALVALKGYQEFKKGKELYIEDLAQYLVTLEAGGIDISRIALSRSLDKYWSEDVAQFVSEGLVFGFLSHKSPLEFDDRCLEVCKRAIDSRISSDQDLRPIVKKAQEILELESIDALAYA